MKVAVRTQTRSGSSESCSIDTTTDQENIAKQIAGVLLTGEEKALYINNDRSKQWRTREDRNHNWHTDGESNKDNDKEKNYQKEGKL